MLAHPVPPWLTNTDRDPGNGYGTKMRPRKHHLTFAESQHLVIYIANPGGALDDAVEDWRYDCGRAADDAEHFGSCRLVFESLTQFGVTLLNLLKQPHVLDGDDRLIGKNLKKRNLLIGKRSHFRASYENRSDGKTLSQEWRSDHGVAPVAGSSRFGERKFHLRRCLDIVDMYQLPIDYGSPGDRATIQRRLQIIRASENRPVVGCIPKKIAIKPVNDRIVR